MGFKIVDEQTENPFSKLVSGQTIVEVPEFTLESGDKIFKVPVAYKTWGKLNDKGDNCMLIAHALTGSADVKDWWGPLIGRDRAFDPTKFFIICLNSLGSPYGSASPVTMDGEYNERYGPEFPLCTVRDDVRIHKLVLDSLGVKQIAVCIGGSMGGMLALEWCFVDGGKFVRSLVALATSARHSAWCISWGEAQRQCIYSDPKYDDGYYSLDDPPVSGLGAARMAALLTYRSRNSFEKRFGRGAPTQQQKSKDLSNTPVSEDSSAVEDSPSTKEENWQIHNDGAAVRSRKSFESRHASRSNSIDSSLSSADSDSIDSSVSGKKPRRRPQHYFSAQSYLRYQAQKFHQRFDANCYISITRKLDTHDVGRDRPEFDNDAAKALQSLQIPALVIGIDSDALFTLSEQIFIAKNIPNSTLKKIHSPEGHDAFLLEFKEINDLVMDFEKTHLKEIMDHDGNNMDWSDETVQQKESVFGEAEDVANW
ncbi:hypothetical protein OGAPHI_002420 [Ogataea philodendri]|uniref:AB hydrolase-1 domain-containing protein n=1 Tax=Ogataea philodendri TaxID=1378263 RepID=A0A9P8PBF6_9ASCO|nr:uncharacterized protein OGAPHI_002420 [Ogataea philodendri]KAH3668666.1 hypothetical protein OGAPHI_002420 [Ogataea philodendri]